MGLYGMYRKANRKTLAPEPVGAEREGFEPSRRLYNAYAISNPNEPMPPRIALYQFG